MLAVLNHGWYTADVLRMPLTPVTSTTHGLAVREAAACSASGQLPSRSTRWKRSRNVASAGSERIASSSAAAASVRAQSL